MKNVINQTVSLSINLKILTLFQLFTENNIYLCQFETKICTYYQAQFKLLWHSPFTRKLIKLYYKPWNHEKLD